MGLVVLNKENILNMIHCFDTLGMQMENSDTTFSVLINCVID